MAFLRSTLYAAVIVATFAGISTGQSTPAADLTVRVRVLDTERAPVAGVDVSIVRGLQEVVAHATTDNGGRASLAIARGSGDLQLTVRKIGYQPADQFFAAPKLATTSLEIVLRRAVQTLAPVAVTAREDVKRKAYHVDADVIANSSRPLFDGMDIVTKLMPDAIYGRSGKGTDCGVKDVWVNGSRILFPPSNEMVSARVPGATPIPTPQLAMNGSGSGRRQPMSAVSSVDIDVWLILATIKPEHIEEMTYEDCFSTTVTDHTHASRALFVVLKQGVGYDAARGSYVIGSEESPVRRAPPPSVASDANGTPIPAYRARLLGLFDPLTGNPVDHAIVADSASGLRAETTMTGTVSLMFLPEGASTLFISKPGYTGLRVDVMISPADTLPVTLLLTRP